MPPTQEFEIAMNTISFNSANFVAREIGYNLTQGWMQGDAATQAWFRPLDTFAVRFGAMLDEVVALGFDAIDLWLAHLNPAWATDEHISIAASALEARALSVPTLAGAFGDTPELFLMSCRIATRLGASVLGGGAGLLNRDRAFVIDSLTAHGIRLGLENHPEKTPQILRDRIGEGRGVIGAMIDTGWFGTQGYDAARSIEELKDVLFGVHLKDVLQAGAHNTCRFGLGVVPLRECVQALKLIGWTGPISVEHEPEHADPRDDARASADMLRGWLAAN